MKHLQPDQISVENSVLIEVCEASPRGVLIALQDGSIMHINKRLIDALNINPSLEIGRSLRDSRILGIKRQTELALLVDESRPFVFTNILKKSGEERHWTFSGNVFPGGFIIEGEDLTDQVIRLEEVEKKERKYENEIRIAQSLQRDLFPSNFQKKRIDIYTHLIVADDLAGDFFSITELSPNAIGVVIGDVVGKGIPASLMAMSIHTFFTQEARLMMSPNELLLLVNNMLHNRFKGDFWYATAFYAKINISSLLMTYARGGHEFPLLYRASTGKVEELSGHGMPLGMFYNSYYETRQVQLNEGDRILLFTDGLPDAINAEGERFGHEQLVSFLEENGGKSGSDMMNCLRAMVDEFCEGGEFNDDIALSLLSVVPDMWTTWLIPPKNFNELLESVIAELIENGVNDDTCWDIRLALDECVINAQKHGHHFQMDKPVKVSYLINPGKVTFIIRDTGRGFDYENLPDPTIESNVLLESGRGVYLTRQYMDEVSFNENGNEITIAKYLKPRG